MVIQQKLEEQYLGSSINYNSDNNMGTQYNKYNFEIQKTIKKHTYKKDLYIDDKWIFNSYRKNYEQYVNELLASYGPYKLKNV